MAQYETALAKNNKRFRKLLLKPIKFINTALISVINSFPTISKKFKKCIRLTEKRYLAPVANVKSFTEYINKINIVVMIADRK